MDDHEEEIRKVVEEHILIEIPLSKDSTMNDHKEAIKRVFEEEILHWEHKWEKNWAHKKAPVGLAIAVTAAILAVATMMSHRTHTKEVKIEGERNTLWANYDRKRIVEHMYESDATIASLLNNGRAADEFRVKADAERQGENIGKSSEKKGSAALMNDAKASDKELVMKENQALAFDWSECILEFAIVICSVSLLKNSQLFYKISLVVTGLGVLVLLYAFWISTSRPWLTPNWLFPH